MKKYLHTIFLIILSSANSFCQSTVIVTACDTVITNPSNLFTAAGGNYLLTIKSANNTKIGYSIDYYNSNYGDIYVYNGLDNTGALLSHLGDFFNVPNQVYAGQSTTSSITLTFPGRDQGSALHFRMRVRCVEPPAATSVLQPLKGLNGSGNIKAADYDNDGDEDLVIGNKVFRNDSYFDSSFKFERISNVIGSWRNTNICSADFDGDGFKDIFITGNSTIPSGLLRPSAVIYRNNGNNNFTLVSQPFTGATRGGCSIVDFNSDGKPDICYTGSTDYSNNNNLIFKIYLNNGNMNFTDAGINLPAITGLINSSMSWADSEGDGDLDLVINGHRGDINVTALFLRSGNNFTNQNLPLTLTSMGKISWIDVNMDGKPDIVNTGVATRDNVNAVVPQILFNNGNNNFTNSITNLPPLAFVSSDWTDYDGDGDKDVIMNGWTLPTGTGSTSGVFKNNGNGQFTKISSLNGADRSTHMQWVDFNHDGKMDVMTGGYFIKNMGADSFKISSFTTTTYENYTNATIIDDFNNDGYPDIMIAGESMTDVDCNSSNASTLVIGRGWKYAAEPKYTEVFDVSSITPTIPSSGWTTQYYYRWADFDSDGLPDILMSGDNYADNATNFLIVFKNNGNHTFRLIFNSLVTPLPVPPFQQYSFYRYVGVFDIDNDGVNELFLSPNVVYKNIGGNWQISSNSTNNVGGKAKYMDFADYNRDGFMDVAVNGGGGVILYKNDGAGNMVNITPAPQGYTWGSLAGESERQIQWVDMDKDVDMDLLTSTGILENRRDTLEMIINPIPEFVHAAMGDFNNDGFKDLVTVPRMTNNFGPMKMYYSEQATGFFTEHLMGTLANPTVTNILFNEAVVAYDMDNDGDDDFIYSGSGSCTIGAQIVINEGNFTDRSIHVISPNGRETYSVNNTVNIRWFGNQLPATVKIELSRDSGITWQTIAANAPSTVTGGTYAWLVSAPVSDKCLIRIADNSLNDKSNAVFRIISSLPVVNAGRDTTICRGSSIILGTSVSGIYSYAWSSSGGSFSSAIANPVVSPDVTTSYYLTVSNGSFVGRDTVVISVSSLSVTPADTLINACIGNSYSLGINQQPNVLYEWTSNPVGFTSSMANPYITSLIPGSTLYYVNAIDIITGCVADAYVHVVSDSCGIPTGSVNVFPNPASNQITIQVDPNITLPAAFTLVNSNGAAVATQLLLNNNTTFNVSNFMAGNYYYVISSASGQLITAGSLVIIH